MQALRLKRAGDDMEGFLFGAAVVCFVLAGCVAVVAVIIFAKLNVAYAIRFLRHRPAKVPQRQRSEGGCRKAESVAFPEEDEDAPTCILPEEESERATESIAAQGYGKGL